MKSPSNLSMPLKKPWPRRGEPGGCLVVLDAALMDHAWRGKKFFDNVLVTSLFIGAATLEPKFRLLAARCPKTPFKVELGRALPSVTELTPLF